MPSFENPQTRPFCFEPTEAGSPLHVRVRGDLDTLTYEVNLESWKFLEEILNSRLKFEQEEGQNHVEFWKAVLGYDPEDELEFVRIVGQDSPLIPLDVVKDWPDNAVYEYEIWCSARQKYEKWLTLYRELELPAENSWCEGPPDEGHLRQLEFELAQSLPDRSSVLIRLHGLGILASDDGGKRAEHLAALKCPRLLEWRRAALMHRWISPAVQGMLEQMDGSILASPVGVDWFLDGPYQQRHLDPLFHLKFGLHEHLKREPPHTDSAFVVSMGGRISGAFYYRLGPGGIPQLTRGGEPQASSPHFELYQHAKTSSGDRFAELAGRYLRAGFAELSRALAASWLRRDPSHGQCWVQLGVALHDLGLSKEARSCLDCADKLGHRYYKKGELAEILAVECEADVPEPQLFLRDLPNSVPDCVRDLALTEEVWEEPCLAKLLSKRVPDFVRPSG